MSAATMEPHRLRHQFFLVRRAAASAIHLRHLPEVALEDALPGIGDLEITIAHRFRSRGLPYGDAYVLALVTAYLQPRRIFEIGTGTGEATVLMARQAPSARVDTLDLGASVPTLGTQRGDLPLAGASVGDAFRDSPWSPPITQHLRDSATFDFAPFAGRIDLIFVDGAHTTRYVANDSAAAFAMASPRGVVVWDDCHLYHPAISRVLRRRRRDGTQIFRIAGTRLAMWQSERSPRRRQATASKPREEVTA
jgi:predicted O-methyltransferase YrrM